MKDKKTIEAGLRQKVERGETLVLCGVGSGLTAMASVEGGADLLAVYHTAAYRIAGVPSLLSCLPYDNCNDVSLRLLPQIRTASGETPVLVGLGAHDPRQPHEELIARVIDGGGDGVVNEPFIGAYDGVLRRRLEDAGLGVRREVELMERASRKGLFTHAWCFGLEDAAAMVNAGASLIGALVKPRPGQGLTREEIISYVQSIVEAVARTGCKAPVLIHGGPVNDRKIAADVIRHTGAAGYATGSSGERAPVLDGVRQAVAGFKSIRKGS